MKNSVVSPCTVFLSIALLVTSAVTSLAGHVGTEKAANEMKQGDPVLYRTVRIPDEFLTEGRDGPFGGDIRMGDLTGNGTPDFLVYRAVDDFHDGGGMKPCFLAAFTMQGDALWQEGGGGLQPGRPGAVAIHDIDGDSNAEVVCFFRDSAIDSPPTSMENVVIQIRNGATGQIEKMASPAALRTCGGSGANWAHQRIMFADFSGRGFPGDFVVKLGENVLAFDNNLEILWTYVCPWTEYTMCPSYIPSVGDIDGDGRDEVNGGYFLLGFDGAVLWEKQLSKNMDSVTITAWDSGKTRAFCSGGGHIMDKNGDIVLKLGEELVPHGQELRVGDFDTSSPGPEMVIRYNGHTTEAMLVNVRGAILRRFELNYSPNNTGMETVLWNGAAGKALLYNGGKLFDLESLNNLTLPVLPEPAGTAKLGWYHCIPADVCGDSREEVVLYNPWEPAIRIYTPYPLKADSYSGYRPGPRQYNVRLMD